MTRKYINIQLEEETIRHLDTLSKNLNRKRKQVLELMIEKIVNKKIQESDFTI